MRILLAAAVLALSPSAALAAAYSVDGAHSEVTFKIRHLTKRLSGRFTKFSADISYEAGKPQTWKVDAAIDAASINTDHEKRDAHLRSPDFFDVEKCPELRFKSTKVEGGKDGKARLHGDLTMHCVTKPVVLELEVGGLAKDPWGNAHVGFSATGKVNRKDFGIVWNKALDAGGVVLGEEVDIALEIDAVEKKKS